MVHNDADADQETDIEAVTIKDFVNAATFHVDGPSKPGYTSTLGLEFPFNHVAEMNCLIVHFVSILKIDTKIVVFTILQTIFEKYF